MQPSEIQDCSGSSRQVFISSSRHFLFQDVFFFFKWKWHTVMMPLTFSSHLLEAIFLQRRLRSQQLQSASWSQQGSSCWFLFMRTSSYCSLVRRPSVMLLLSSNLGNITAMYPSVEGCAKKNERRSHSCGLAFEKRWFSI